MLNAPQAAYSSTTTTTSTSESHNWQAHPSSSVAARRLGGAAVNVALRAPLPRYFNSPVNMSYRAFLKSPSGAELGLRSYWQFLVSEATPVPLQH